MIVQHTHFIHFIFMCCVVITTKNRQKGRHKPKLANRNIFTHIHTHTHTQGSISPQADESKYAEI